VAAGYALRVGLEAWIGASLPTYITFYPAMMVAALLGGIGPGLLATALAALVASMLVLKPIGRMDIASPAELITLALFCGMGVLVTAVAALDRRSRSKAAAAEYKEALRAVREQAEDELRRATSNPGISDENSTSD
jgi:K+-sensing histidine kinase KdpD